MSLVITAVYVVLHGCAKECLELRFASFTVVPVVTLLPTNVPRLMIAEIFKVAFVCVFVTSV